MNEQHKLAAIYIRVSTIDQAEDGYSLDAQEKILRKWCDNNGYDVYDIYADRGISGKDISHRPDMIRLIEDAKTKKFDTVLFWALSRFTRSVNDLYNTMELFQSLDISMISYTEPFNTSSPIGRAMIGIVGIFAQLERELTGERVSLAMEERAAQGKRTCSEILGYDIVGKDTFSINDAEAEYVRFCFNEYLRCKNLSTVASRAKEIGYKGKRGKEPSAYAVERILTTAPYCGYNRFKGKLYKGTYDPIVSVEVYNSAQRLIEDNVNKAGRKRKDRLLYVEVDSKGTPVIYGKHSQCSDAI